MSSRVMVTGAAGFIGSTLVDSLLESGNAVVGVDCFTNYYETELKLAHLASALQHPRFTLLRLDLVEQSIARHLDGVATVFHLAGQPGVRSSWSTGFNEYTTRNILATQRLLEACAPIKGLRVVNASSSSVYGNWSGGPVRERDDLRPISPYGVSKLAAEKLCNAYTECFGIETVSLRYFSVYGPRQRPDMAIMRLIQAAVAGTSFTLHGRGQSRDFTFVEDVVRATQKAATTSLRSPVFNVGGGSTCRVEDLIQLVELHIGERIKVIHVSEQTGDVQHTSADISLAATELDWKPEISLSEGIQRQVLWHLANSHYARA